MATNVILDRIEKLCRQVDLVAKDCTEKLSAFGLPTLPAEIGTLISRMRESQYTVLVMGEAKRGKSSFVNAVIGRPLLPTAVEVATSQVFCISQAAQAANRLRFEDGSSRPINDDDLLRYGSQVFADNEGAPPEAGDILRWIEVDVPIKFLPDGISLLDTPGLGSVYAAHGRITNRFVPLADGVIYVLDADKPMVEDDIKYISMVLERTSSLFFILTRIDRYDRDHWQTVQKRDQEILRTRFGNQLPDARIWPISNTNLMKAAKTGDSDYMKVSKFNQLSEALQAFLFRVGGLNLTIQAAAILVDHHAENWRVMERQLANLQEESKERREANQREIAEWQRKFQETWGERGEKRTMIVRQVRGITSRGRTEFSQTLWPGGLIDKHVGHLIDNASSVAEIKALGEEIKGIMVSLAMEAWQRITSDTRDGCARLMLPLMEDARTLSFVGTDRYLQIDAGPANINADDGAWQQVKGGRMDAFTVGALNGTLVSVLTALGVSLGPIGWGALALAGACSTLWAWVHGSSKVKEQQLQNAQKELRAYVTQVLTAIRNETQAVLTDHDSFVDSYFEKLNDTVTEQVDSLVERKTNEAKAQLSQLQKDAEFDQQRRIKEIAALQEKLRQWQTLGRSITQLAEEIKGIDRELSAAAQTV